MINRLLTSNAPPPTTSQLVITVPILVTATTDPNAGPTIKIVTATPQPGTVILPTGILVTPDGSSVQTVGTIDANAVAINPIDSQSPGGVSTVLPDKCILHTLVEGDTPFAVAEQYGADPFKLMEVNGLNDETASLLQIGDTLIVPLEGCPLTGPVTTPVPTLSADALIAADATEEATAEATEGPKLGQFPLFNFWGPNASIKSTKWIADASVWVDRQNDPTLTLIYLPHLDYCLQKFGPDFSKISKELNEIDQVVADLVKYYESKNTRIILLSEYGINPVHRPVHINRILREEGLISVRTERWYELLDAGASKAFPAADHQIAHMYINDPAVKAQVKKRLEQTEGIELVLDEEFFLTAMDPWRWRSLMPIKE